MLIHVRLMYIIRCSRSTHLLVISGLEEQAGLADTISAYCVHVIT